MARKEFSREVKREAWKRCGGRCEGVLSTGIRCNAVLDGKRKDFDHINPDGLTGQPTLENCAVLCELCHLEKTAKIDIPAIARAKRRSDAHLGISTSSKPLQSGQSLPGANPARRASRPLEKSLPPRRGLYSPGAGP